MSPHGCNAPIPNLPEVQHHHHYPPREATLRDEFAMAALTGILAGPDMWITTVKDTVASTYAFADAMMAEREKKP